MRDFIFVGSVALPVRVNGRKTDTEKLAYIRETAAKVGIRMWKDLPFIDTVDDLKVGRPVDFKDAAGNVLAVFADNAVLA